MSRHSAKHRKSSRPGAAQRASSTRRRHRKPSTISVALNNAPVKVAAGVAGTGLVALGVVAPFATNGNGHPHTSAGLSAAADLGSSAAGGSHGSGAGGGQVHGHGAARLPGSVGRSGARTGARRAKAAPSGRSARHGQPQHPAVTAAVYRNPLRDITGLIPERIDMGVDFGGTGPIYALGDAVITNASGSNGGWPGGGWITYRLTSGPAAGLTVYVAEDVRPTVQVGQQVTSSTVIANMYNFGDGIETGWAQPSGFSAESQLPEAGGIWGGGPFPTEVGLNFEQLLMKLGVPAGNNYGQQGYGILPSNYPADWATEAGL